MQSVHKELAQELLAAVARRFRQGQAGISEAVIQPRTSIILQKESPEFVYIILHGSMKIHLNTPKGNEFLVAIEGPGVLFGEVEALTGEAATCSVTALMESKVAKISLQAYPNWLNEDHAFALLVNRIITYRLQIMTKRAATHLSYPMEYSVLKLLKMMAEERSSLRLHVSKEDIANYLGTSVRSINRILKDLCSKHVISPAQKIEIITMEGLENVMRQYDA
ncbi:Crp/Fnr family transcriptional regulator [Desulfovibrio inopinatus]|uniref:Crp/Fnr family transcriptional regulator n=1 Tax=Desulfovibrio inopinatus TaxID=102109 RepID=UPI00041232E1|nr:Crp/Fnr family transcriptional regulator [Desulfovibrio inopinatus]